MKTIVQHLLVLFCTASLFACGSGLVVLKEPPQQKLSMQSVCLQVDTTYLPAVKALYSDTSLSLAFTHLPSQIHDLTMNLSDALRKRNFHISSSHIEAQLLLIIQPTRVKGAYAAYAIDSGKLVDVLFEEAIIRVKYQDRTGAELCMIEGEFPLLDDGQSFGKIVSNYTLDTFGSK